MNDKTFGQQLASCMKTAQSERGYLGVTKGLGKNLI